MLDALSMTVVFIVVSVVMFVIFLALNVFFLYLPVKRIEDQVNATAQKLDAEITPVANAVEPFVPEIRAALCQAFPDNPVCHAGALG